MRVSTDGIDARAAWRVLLALILSGIVGFMAVTLLRGEIPLARAGATSNCHSIASGGYANCLDYGNPSFEIVQPYHESGLPYKYRLHRFSDGASWGPWTWSSLDKHVVGLSLGGTIMAQVDNLGWGNPSVYYNEMLW